MRGTVVRWGPKGFGFIESPELPVQAYFNTRCVEDADYWPTPGDGVDFQPFERSLGRVEARRVRHTLDNDPQSPLIAAVSPPAPVVLPPAAVPSAPAEPQSQTIPPPLPDPSKRRTLNSVLEKLRKSQRREAVALEDERLKYAQEVESAAGGLEDARKALQKAENIHGRAQAALQAHDSRRNTLPSEQKAQKETEIVQFISTERERVARILADRVTLAADVRKERGRAADRVGEEVVATYEAARERAASDADPVARRAYSALEKSERAEVLDYATVRDRMESLAEEVVPLVLFRSPSDPTLHTLILPLAKNGAGNRQDWRLISAFVEAVRQASDEETALELGSVAGCYAARVRSADFESFVSWGLEEAFSARPSIGALKLKPEVEVCEEHSAFENVEPLEMRPRDLRPRRALGGTMQEIAERLGLSIPAMVVLLRRHNLPFPDDRLSAEVERTLHRLLGVPAAEEPNAPAAEPADVSGEGLDSVQAAIERIQSEFPERIVVRLNSQSEARNNPFEDAPAFYRALRFLTTTYWDARTGAAKCVDFDAPLRSTSGFWYRPSQSDVTMATYSNHYETTWKGSRVQLEEHLGRGDSRDARFTMRIGIHWDPEARVVVVGYVGQHQRTRAT